MTNGRKNGFQNGSRGIWRHADSNGIHPPHEQTLQIRGHPPLVRHFAPVFHLPLLRVCERRSGGEAILNMKATLAIAGLFLVGAAGE